MSTLISQANIEAIKAELRRIVPAKNSHRIEAIARGLGYRTYAALRADLELSPRACQINALAFSEYLKGRCIECAPEIFQEAIARVMADESAIVLLHTSGAAYLKTRSENLELPDRLEAFLAGDGAVAEFRRTLSDVAPVLVKMIPHRGCPIFVAVRANDGWPASGEQFHPLLRELNALRDAGYWWHTQGYRQLCHKMAIDPDAGRPNSKHLSEDDVAALFQLQNKVLMAGSRVTSDCWTFMDDGLNILNGIEIGNGALTKARRVARRILAGRDDIFGGMAVDERLLARFCQAVLACERPLVSAYTAIRFLPSADGTGCLSSIYGGCDPQKGWYANIGGPPLSQSFIVRPDLDADTLYENFVVRLLEREGVTVLDEKQAEEYLAVRSGRAASRYPKALTTKLHSLVNALRR